MKEMEREICIPLEEYIQLRIFKDQNEKASTRWGTERANLLNESVRLKREIVELNCKIAKLVENKNAPIGEPSE